MVGTTISHYKVLEKIGQGGMGEVYLAEDSRLDRNDGRGSTRMIGKKQVLFAVLFLLSVFSLSPAWVWAQGGDAGEGGGGGGGDQGQQQPQEQEPQQPQRSRQPRQLPERPIYLTGKVMLDDGQEPGILC